MNTSKLTCCCLICRKEVTVRNFHVHYFRIHTERGRQINKESTKKAASISLSKSKNRKSALINEYNNSPNTCKNCGKLLPFEKRSNKFCSQSCSCTYNNNQRTKTTKGKTKTLICTVCGEEYEGSIHTRKSKGICDTCKNPVIDKYPHCRLHINTCQKTETLFCSSTWKKYNPSIIGDKDAYYMACKFEFSISKFPEWFDGSIIKNHGMYSTPGSRRGVKNTNGVSRDHLVSVSYGWENNIDPNIISHPANCDLKLHKDNQKKRHKCEITIEDLKERIKSFEKIYPNWNIVTCPPG